MAIKRAGPPQLRLGPLPVDRINKALDLELEEGEVVFSPNAQKHAAGRHPEDYPLFLPHIGAVIANPLYAGDDFKNPGKIELIGGIPGGGGFMLVAVSVKVDEDGNYHIHSMYRVGRTKIDSRRDNGFLKAVP